MVCANEENCEPYVLNLHPRWGFIGYQSHGEEANQLNSLEPIDFFNY